jgi:hypothetical protein
MCVYPAAIITSTRFVVTVEFYLLRGYDERKRCRDGYEAAVQDVCSNFFFTEVDVVEVRTVVFEEVALWLYLEVARQPVRQP